MFTGHTLKVIIGFCGMILLGLLSLLFIDGIDQKQQGSANGGFNTPDSVASPTFNR